jgi:hypothetical protein
VPTGGLISPSAIHRWQRRTQPVYCCRRLLQWRVQEGMAVGWIDVTPVRLFCMGGVRLANLWLRRSAPRAWRWPVLWAVSPRPNVDNLRALTVFVDVSVRRSLRIMVITFVARNAPKIANSLRCEAPIRASPVSRHRAFRSCVADSRIGPGALGRLPA